MSKIREEHLRSLNRLIEEGEPAAVEHYIGDHQIKPDAYYEYFRSNYVYHRLGVVGQAARYGKVEILKLLLELGFLLDELQPYFYTVRPIHEACEGGSLAAVKMLVEEYGVDVTNSHNGEYRSPICVAAEYGHVDILQYFLDRGISVDDRFGPDSMSALHAAAENDKAEVCKFLLSKGADVNLRDKCNNTPLMYTVKYRSFSATRVLLDFGADVNLTNSDGLSVFFLAAGEASIDIMTLLHSHGADPEFSDRSLRSPLHLAVDQNHYRMTFFLVNELNVALNPPEYYRNTEKGKTVCSLAMEEGHYDLVRLLINAGYDPSVELAEYMDGDNTGPEDMVELQKLRELISTPRSLIALCALTVRRVLGRRFRLDLNRVPLPEILKKQLVDCGEKKNV